MKKSCCKVIKIDVNGGGGDQDQDQDRRCFHGDDLKNNEIVIIHEIMNIKETLLNKENESDLVLMECLRKLESMPMNLNILQVTKIVVGVRGLEKHNDEKINKLANTLVAEWKEILVKYFLADQRQEDSVVEVLNIKEKLLNTDDESKSDLIESLKKLEAIPMNINILEVTKIGMVVNRLKMKYKYDSFDNNIINLTTTLTTNWTKLLYHCKGTKKCIVDPCRCDESQNIGKRKHEDSNEVIYRSGKKK